VGVTGNDGEYSNGSIKMGIWWMGIAMGKGDGELREAETGKIWRPSWNTWDGMVE
jgi:hypothetical protein